MADDDKMAHLRELVEDGYLSQEVVANAEEAIMERSASVVDCKPAHTRVGLIAGSVAGILASTAVGWFINDKVPVMDTKFKQYVMKAGMGLVSGAVGSFVADDVTKNVDETVDAISQFRHELESRKAENDG